MKCEKQMIEETGIKNNGRKDLIAVGDRNAYASNDLFNVVFNRKDVKCDTSFSFRKKLTIASKDNGQPICRMWNVAPYVNKAKYDFLMENESDSVSVINSKKSRLFFYMNHHDPMIRISFKLSLLAMLLGIVSYVVQVIVMFS